MFNNCNATYGFSNVSRKTELVKNLGCINDAVEKNGEISLNGITNVTSLLTGKVGNPLISPSCNSDE